MSEIVNLRQAKKQRARAEKEARAEANRAKFGRTKEETRLVGDAVEEGQHALGDHRAVFF